MFPDSRTRHPRHPKTSNANNSRIKIKFADTNANLSKNADKNSTRVRFDPTAGNQLLSTKLRNRKSGNQTVATRIPFLSKGRMRLGHSLGYLFELYENRKKIRAKNSFLSFGALPRTRLLFGRRRILLNGRMRFVIVIVLKN